MSEDTKYSVSALAERAARCKEAMDRENSDYFDSVKAWIRSCCDRLRAVEPDIAAVLSLAKNMVSMGLATAMDEAGLSYAEIRQDLFAKGVRITYRNKIALNLNGFVLDAWGTSGNTRLIAHYRATISSTCSPSVIFGDLSASPGAYDVDEYARYLLKSDMVIGKSRDKMREYMAEVDDLIDNGLPAFIQKLCEFADKNIDNK